jgi:hypothetical protein
MERPEAGSFVTIPEAARRSGLGPRQLRRAIKGDDLPVYDVGGWPRLRWLEVVEWIESRRRRKLNCVDLGALKELTAGLPPEAASATWIQSLPDGEPIPANLLSLIAAQARIDRRREELGIPHSPKPSLAE